MARAGLVRSLGLGSACALVVGSVIGAGAFLVAADISRSLPSPRLALSVWVAAGLLSLLGGLTFAELGAMYPGTGGQYVYLREAFGPLTGFLFGWTQFLVVQAGSIAAVAISFAQFSASTAGSGPFGLKGTATLVIVALTAVNLIGTDAGAGVLDWLTGLKYLAIAALAGAGLCVRHQAFPQAAASLGASPAAYGVALIAALWAYDGWTDVTFVSGEIKDPQRNVPRALFLGLLAVMAAYVGINAAFYRLLPAPAIAASEFVAADAARALAGPGAALAVSWLMMVSTLGCVNAMVLAGPRIAYAMAEDRSLPGWLAYVSPRFRVPTGALLIQMAWSILLVWSGRYDQLFTCVISAAFIFYGLGGAAVLVLRKTKPNTERPFRVPLYPLLPLGYIAFTAAFTANTLREKPLESLAGLGIMLLGLPVYFYYRRKVS